MGRTVKMKGSYANKLFDRLSTKVKKTKKAQVKNIRDENIEDFLNFKHIPERKVFFLR